MKLKLNYESFDKGLEKLSEEYKIFAPVVLEYKGTYSDTPSIRYKEVKTFEEMEWTLKSHFSPKEVMLPINEILLYDDLLNLRTTLLYIATGTKIFRRNTISSKVIQYGCNIRSTLNRRYTGRVCFCD